MHYHFDVAKPLSVGLDPGLSASGDFGLKRSRADDLSRSIPLGFEVSVHLEPLDGGFVPRLTHASEASCLPVRIHTVN